MNRTQDIWEAAEAELRFDPMVEAKIEVRYDTEPAEASLLVHRTLARSAMVPADSNVRAATAGNTVTLTGHVRTAAGHDAIVGAAWMANGVCAVIDELHVTAG